jgi:hypothetical protein
LSAIDEVITSLQLVIDKVIQQIDVTNDVAMEATAHARAIADGT